MNARLGMQMHVAASNNGGVTIPTHYRFVCLLEAHHGSGACGVDGHGRALGVQEVRDAV